MRPKKVKMWEERERKEGEQTKLDTSNGRTRQGSWLSQSLRNPNKVWRTKSRSPLESRWMILPGPLSRSVDSSMSNRCSFTAPFARIFSSRCFNRIRFLIFQFQSSFGRESRFSLFNFSYRRNQCNCFNNVFQLFLTSLNIPSSTEWNKVVSRLHKSLSSLYFSKNFIFE